MLHGAGSGRRNPLKLVRKKCRSLTDHISKASGTVAVNQTGSVEAKTFWSNRLDSASACQDWNADVSHAHSTNGYLMKVVYALQSCIMAAYTHWRHAFTKVSANIYGYWVFDKFGLQNHRYIIFTHQRLSWIGDKGVLTHPNRPLLSNRRIIICKHTISFA